MDGMRNKLFVFENGTIIYIEETGLRPAMSGTRTWNKGSIDEQELETIILFIKDIGFTELQDNYYQPDNPQSDLHYTITIDYQDITRTVIASGYFAPDSLQPYQKLPCPLDEIYKKLMDIAENRTEEVYKETF
jgi:hypothetical protein